MKPTFITSLLKPSILMLVAVAAFSAARAQLPAPPPDGGYLGGNTAEGEQALINLNISVSNNTGLHNTAVGFQALFNDKVGNENTAVGWQALFKNAKTNNTALGYRALHENTTGQENTAEGGEALLNNFTGNWNTATGYRSLFSITNGSDNNTADGSQALRNNTGSWNTAVGSEALLSATTGSNGSRNTAIGYEALISNQSGGQNTADGYAALAANQSGSQNTATGFNALVKSTGNSNIGLGQRAGSNLTTGDYNIDIGNPGIAGEAKTIRIGDNSQTRTFIVGIRNTTTLTGTVPVVIDSNGQLGAVGSSECFKKEIKPMEESSSAVLALKPVTFRYKNDGTDTPQFGLIAEQVEKVAPDLVVRDADGKVFSVRYDAVNAMVLNEFLKQHRRVQEQQQIIEELNSAIEKEETVIAKQQKTLEMLEAGLKDQAAKTAGLDAKMEARNQSARLVDGHIKAAHQKRHS